MSNDDKLKVRLTESKKKAFKELTIVRDTIFSELPFVLDFFASCEKWFATLKKVLIKSLAIKILAL